MLLERLLSEEELCEKLGRNKVTLWRWRRARKNPLPHLKVGPAILYDPDEVDQWLRRCAVVPSATGRRGGRG